MHSPTIPPLPHWSAHRFTRQVARIGTLVLVAIACFTLTGCMQYDVSVNFHTPQAGEFVQSIQISDRLTALGNRSTQDWLHSLEERARSVHGSVKHLNRQDLQITVPFSTGKDFVEKFNQWFNPEPLSAQPLSAQPLAQSPPPSSALRPPSSLISTQLTLKQANYLLAVRHVLDLEVDLRSLGVSSESGQVLVVPGSLLDLNFQVTAPGGVRNLNPAENHDTTTPLGQTWRLQPGQVNHITAAFWVANPLGWGAIIIAGLVALGTLIQPLIQARRSTV